VPECAGRLRVISPAFLRQAHLDGGRVDVWVVDTRADIIRLFDWGVDGVISDRPDIAVETLRLLKKPSSKEAAQCKK
jgi:glycerophosphoryl diester phosphodiesterase